MLFFEKKCYVGMGIHMFIFVLLLYEVYNGLYMFLFYKSVVIVMGIHVGCIGVLFMYEKASWLHFKIMFMIYIWFLVTLHELYFEGHLSTLFNQEYGSEGIKSSLPLWEEKNMGFCT